MNKIVRSELKTIALGVLKAAAVATKPSPSQERTIPPVVTPLLVVDEHATVAPMLLKQPPAKVEMIPVDIVIFRILLLSESQMYTFPELSKSRDVGLYKVAAVARPPSPVERQTPSMGHE